jgi:hypothetical protein
MAAPVDLSAEQPGVSLEASNSTAPSTLGSGRKARPRSVSYCSTSSDDMFEKYMDYPGEAHDAVHSAMLEEVPADCLPAQGPSSLHGQGQAAEAAAQPTWYRLRGQLRLDATPGLRDYLRAKYASAMRSQSVDVNDVIGLLEGGGESPMVEVRGITKRGHPLAKVPRAAGLFATTDIPANAPLGFYAGALLPDSEIIQWRASLGSVEEQKRSWAYDYEVRPPHQSIVCMA